MATALSRSSDVIPDPVETLISEIEKADHQTFKEITKTAVSKVNADESSINVEIVDVAPISLSRTQSPTSDSGGGGGGAGAIIGGVGGAAVLCAAAIFVYKRRGTSSSKTSDKAGEEKDLPSGWTAHFDAASGRYYYFNSNTKATTWVKPKPQMTGH